MSLMRWLVALAAILALIGCADARRPEKVNPLVEMYEDRGYEFAGEDDEAWWFLERIAQGSHGRTFWTYLVVAKDDGEERTVVQAWPEFE